MLIISQTVFAGRRHYNDLLVGTRAMGLGGAFTALSDDPSGVAYNPGGLVFARKEGVSGSANAYVDQRIVYENVFDNEDFTYKSSGLVPAFFGNLRHFDFLGPKLTGAFGIYSIRNEIVDQELEASDVEALSIPYLYQKMKIEDSETHFSGALAYKISDNLGAGLSLTYFRVRYIEQKYLKMKLGPIDNEKKTEAPIFINEFQNITVRANTDGLQLTPGIRYNLSTDVSFGISVSLGFLIEDSASTNLKSDAALTKEDGSFYRDDEIKNSDVNTKLIDSSKQSNFDSHYGEWPKKIRTGFAWRLTPNLLWATDIHHVFEIPKPKSTLFNERRRGVTNLSTGTEYLLTPSVPIRFGLFSNYDSAPNVTATSSEFEHLNFYGGSLFGGFSFGESSFTGGIVYQRGAGRSKPVNIADQNPILDVHSDYYVFALGISSAL